MQEGFVEALLIGFVGALVGGILAYVAAMRAARFTMEKTAFLDRQRREEERAEIHRRLTAQLLAEIKDNIRVLERPKLEFGFAVLVHDIWNTAKGQVSFATPEIGESVRQAYTQVYWYNAVVAAGTVDLAAVRWLSSMPLVENRGKEARAALERAAHAIEQT